VPRPLVLGARDVWRAITSLCYIALLLRTVGQVQFEHENLTTAIRLNRRNLPTRGGAMLNHTHQELLVQRDRSGHVLKTRACQFIHGVKAAIPENSEVRGLSMAPAIAVAPAAARGLAPPPAMARK